MSPMEAVQEIAKRLKDPRQVGSTGYARLDPWNPLSLGKGYPGIVLFYAEMDRHFPEEGWDHVAHQYLVTIQKELETRGVPDLSLFSGLAGIAYAFRMASRDGARYLKVLEKLDALLARQLPDSLPYELIQGKVGIGVYLLVSHHPALETLLQDLVKSISTPISKADRLIPGWYRVDPRQAERYPQGYWDFGMAHGLAGAMAFLAIALKSGHSVSGQQELLREMVNWLLSKAQSDECGPFWPERIALDEDGDAATPRAAWCYGNAGIGRALKLSAEALADAELRTFAASAIYSCFQRAEWDLFSPTLCHGYAGLLHVTSGKTEKQGLIQRILHQYHAQYPYGFRHATRQNPEGYDHPGFLDGAAGIALALLAQEKRLILPWDRVLLLN